MEVLSGATTLIWVFGIIMPIILIYFIVHFFDKFDKNNK